MRALRRRLDKLERRHRPQRPPVETIIQDVGESEEAALLRHFGPEGPPEGTSLVIISIVEPGSWEVGA